jgi:hypothetical protein
LGAGRESMAGRRQCISCPTNFPKDSGITASRRLVPALWYLPARPKTSPAFVLLTRCLSVARSATLVCLGPSALKRPSSAATKFRFAKSSDRSPQCVCPASPSRARAAGTFAEVTALRVTTNRLSLSKLRREGIKGVSSLLVELSGGLPSLLLLSEPKSAQNRSFNLSGSRQIYVDPTGALQCNCRLWLTPALNPSRRIDSYPDPSTRATNLLTKC